MTDEQIQIAAEQAIETIYGTRKSDMRAFSSELESAAGYLDGFIAGAKHHRDRPQSSLMFKGVNISDLDEEEEKEYKEFLLERIKAKDPIFL